jgi:hypothetical protein
MAASTARDPFAQLSRGLGTEGDATVNELAKPFPLNLSATSKHATVTFDDSNGKTKLTVHVQLESAAEREKLVSMGFLRVFPQTLSSLARHLDKFKK